MAYFSLLPEWILMIKFLIILIFFLMKNQCFICNEETLYATVCCRDLKYVEI